MGRVWALQSVAMSYLYTSLYCGVVGYIAWLAVAEATLKQAFIVSFSIGLTINTASVMLRKRLARRLGSYPTAVLLTLLGLVLGMVLGGQLALKAPTALFVGGNSALAASIVFGCIGYIVVSTRETLLRTEAKLARLQLEAATQEKLIATAELRLLQAQIEPHFLFNTLTNVAALIATDPEGAESMLENLTVLLRSSLDSTRSLETTLAEELELVEAYLAIQSVRLRGRLRSKIEHDRSLDAVRLPPLTLQPLLENAVKYAIELSERGGMVQVRTFFDDAAVNICIIDSGRGMDDKFIEGIGITNVRKRLQSFRGGASLTFIQRPQGGLEAVIALPRVFESASSGG